MATGEGKPTSERHGHGDRGDREDVTAHELEVVGAGPLEEVGQDRHADQRQGREAPPVRDPPQAGQRDEAHRHDEQQPEHCGNLCRPGQSGPRVRAAEQVIETGEHVGALRRVGWYWQAPSCWHTDHGVDDHPFERRYWTDQDEVQQKRREPTSQAGGETAAACPGCPPCLGSEHDQDRRAEHDLVEHGQAEQASTDRGRPACASVDHQCGPGTQQRQAAQPGVGEQAEGREQHPGGEGRNGRCAPAPRSGQPVQAPDQQCPVGEADESLDEDRRPQCPEGGADRPDVAGRIDVFDIAVGPAAAEEQVCHDEDIAFLHRRGAHGQHSREGEDDGGSGDQEGQRTYESRPHRPEV